MIALTFIDYRRYKRYAFWLYAVSLFMLLLTRFVGTKINGARSWLGIGGLGIQPSEPAKVLYILYLALYLEKSKAEPEFRRFVKAFIIMALPMGLILLQPDLGTATVYFPIFLVMCFVANVPMRFLVFIVGVCFATILFTVLPIWETQILHTNIPAINILTNKNLTLCVIGGFIFLTILSLIGKFFFNKKYYYWLTFVFAIITLGLIMSIAAGHVLKDYQIQRLIVFIDPSSDPRGAGWNIIQSKIAIGSGGLHGRGFLHGTQSHYRFLPEQSTDFIFSIISEETGFTGGLVLFTCFFVILLRCIIITKNSPNSYGSFIAIGIFGMFFYHFTLNVGMVMGIMPIAGIPLPFISYGGSALLTNMTTIGFLMSINSRRLEFSDVFMH